MTDRDPVAAGQRLAAWHRQVPVTDQPEHRLTAVSEAMHAGEWTLRSALVRFAQPEPALAAAVLGLVRRLDAALKPATSRLERDSVVTHPGLDRTMLERADPPPGGVVDTRYSDLARIRRWWPDGYDDVVAGYRAGTELDDELLATVPLLTLAVDFDELAAVLTDWAGDAKGPRPAGDVDHRCRAIHARMDALAVPVEERPERFRR